MSQFKSFSGIILIGLIMILIGYLQPVHIQTDILRWLGEIDRVVIGQEPYGDFTWQYPPISIYLTGWYGSFFCSDIYCIQILFICLSFVITYQLYFLLKLLKIDLNIGLIILTSIVFSSVASNHIRLFSIQVYTPALLFAIIGNLLVISNLLSFQINENAKLKILSLSFGISLAIGSKPEWGLASIATIILFLLIPNRRKIAMSEFIKLIIITTLLLIVIYGYPILKFGFNNVYEGLSGYGFAGGQLTEFKSIKIHLYIFVLYIFFLSLLIGIASLKKSRLFLSSIIIILSVIGLFMLLEIKPSIFLRSLINSNHYSSILLLLLSMYFYFIKNMKNYIVPLLLGFMIVMVDLRSIIMGGHFSHFLPFSFLSTILVVYFLGKLNWYIFNWKLNHVKYIFISIILISPILKQVLGQEGKFLKTSRGTLNVFIDQYKSLNSVLSFLNTEDVIVTIPYGLTFEYLKNQQHNIFQTQFVRTRLPQNKRKIVLNQLKYLNPKFIISLNIPSNTILNIKNSKLENPEIWNFICDHYHKEYNFGNFIIFEKR